jgi:hypothetical protein
MFARQPETTARADNTREAIETANILRRGMALRMRRTSGLVSAEKQR